MKALAGRLDIERKVMGKTIGLLARNDLGRVSPLPADRFAQVATWKKEGSSAHPAFKASGASAKDERRAAVTDGDRQKPTRSGPDASAQPPGELRD